MALPTLPFGVRDRPVAPARFLPTPPGQFQAQFIERAAAATAQPFVGLTSDGHPHAGLFPIQHTGVSTRPLQVAAEAFLRALPPEHQAAAAFDIGAPEWLMWNNTHPFIVRHGVCLEALDATQVELAFDLLRATLSARGFELSRDIMRLNETIAEITGRAVEYGEWVYWLSIFGTPSATEPWGWQLDGHHLNVNCFVLGDQVVLAPVFMGSEPTEAPFGKYAGLRVFEPEEQGALQFVHTLTEAQRQTADLSLSRRRVDGGIQGGALADNLRLPYAGLPVAGLSTAQKQGLLRLMDVYVGRLREGHARLQLADLEAVLDDTHVVWVGSIEPDSTFYYRIHSPRILIEFDHLRGVALDNEEPARTHIHTITRVPNGNDYGKDLLRQHYADHPH